MTTAQQKKFFGTIFESDDVALFQEHQQLIEGSYFHSQLTSDLHKELLRYAAVNILRFLSVSKKRAKSYISTTVDYILNEREVTDKRREMMRYLCSQCDATEQLTGYLMFFFSRDKEYFLLFLLELGASPNTEQLATLQRKDAELYERLFAEDV